MFVDQVADATVLFLFFVTALNQQKCETDRVVDATIAQTPSLVCDLSITRVMTHLNTTTGSLSRDVCTCVCVCVSGKKVRGGDEGFLLYFIHLVLRQQTQLFRTSNLVRLRSRKGAGHFTFF